MAEMLVDSTKLDACLDAEADAIRAKTGGSADIPFDFANNKGFADAIAAIPSGGGGAFVRKYTVTTAGSCTKYSELSSMLFGTNSRFCVAVCTSPTPESGVYIPTIFHSKSGSASSDNVIRSLSMETYQPSPSINYANATFGKTMQAGFVYDVYVYWE